MHIYIYIYNPFSLCIHVCIYVYIYCKMYIQTYTHTYVYTYVSLYIFGYIYIYIYISHMYLLIYEASVDPSPPAVLWMRSEFGFEPSLCHQQDTQKEQMEFDVGEDVYPNKQICTSMQHLPRHISQIFHLGSTPNCGETQTRLM